MSIAALPRVTLASVAAVLCPVAALPHGDGYPSLYVTEMGVDAGKCINPTAPCRTIAYALSKAEKGDEIRVAYGTFDFETERQEDALKLLGRVVRVRGGYDPDRGFERSVHDPRVTFLTGPADGFRARLAEAGFFLLPETAQGRMNPHAEVILAQADAPDGPVGYVSQGGADTGDCTNPSAPCQTIAYAVAQAGDGQEIRVSEGQFDLGLDTLADAQARQIAVTGSFARASGFAARLSAPNVAALATVVSGPPDLDRGELARNGIRLQQDRKFRSIAPALRSKEIKGPAACVDGLADGHPCKGIDRIAQMPLGAFSSQPGDANDIWGFRDLNDNREYAIIGLQNGTAVVDVTDPENPAEIGTVPGLSTIWRDVKVYQTFDESEDRWKAYAYVTADDSGSQSHGIVVIDLTDLPSGISVAATLDLVDISHNVYISNVDYSTGAALDGLTPFVYILGSNFGDPSTIGGFFTLDVSDPVNPVVVQSPPAESSYTHDATTLSIDDDRAATCAASPCEVLIDYSEDAVDVWDVTEKGSARKLGSATYPESEYVHSGWWTEDKNFVLIHDELDEVDGGLNTTIRLLDIRDLEAPAIAATWTGPTRAIDHNGFTLGNEYLVSTYRRGLTVLDISDPMNLVANNPEELARFDTYIEAPADDAEFNGAWGTYPFLPSGTILVSDIEGGLFMLRRQ